MNKKKTSPATIAGLAGAAVAAAGFAVWNINRALSGPGAAPPVSQPHPASDAAHGTDGANTEANKPAAETGGARPEASAAAPGATVDPRAVEAPQTRQASAAIRSEAGMAPRTDPFRPLPETEPKPVVSIHPPPPQNTRAKQAPPLPYVGARPTPPAFPKAAEQLQPPPKLEAPELAGTLLGDQPSAVFREERSLVLVPVGGRVGAWKVVSVTYDGAVVKHGQEFRRLAVGGSRAPITPGVPRGGATSAAPPMVEVQPSPAEPMAAAEPPAQKVSMRESQSAPAATPAAPPMTAPDPEPKPEPQVTESPASPASPAAGDMKDDGASPATDPDTKETQPPAAPR